jgi:DNA polymerase
MSDRLALARAYVHQQIELGMPDVILGPGGAKAISGLYVDWPSRTLPAPKTQNRIATAPVFPQAQSPVARPVVASRLLPASRLMGASAPPVSRELDDNVRDSFVALYKAEQGCRACRLADTRNKFVFGSGNVHAPLVIVGEAPGADEDAAGLPFVGAAGAMLTKMLTAIGLDRAKDVFITNVLKCRPPDNRTPESTEVDACKRILLAQIAIIKPKAFLLLGRSAAHALLGSVDSITSLRREIRFVEGIPAFVTYHPAALLHNADNKKPAWEDLKKLRTYLTEQGIHAAPGAGS